MRKRVPFVVSSSSALKASRRRRSSCDRLFGGLASSAYFFDAMSLSSLTSAFSLSSVSRPAMYDGAPLSSASVTNAMRLPRGGAGAADDGCGIALRASSAGRSGSGAGAGAGAASSR